MSYSHVDKPVESELIVKKSRFIARCQTVSSRAEVMQMVEQARLDFPDAGHHCWAYFLGDPALAANAAASDDGEPGGTAGKPILNVLSHSDYGDIAIVVIRYFGGVKLGAGGLVRAYSSAASQVLELVQSVPVKQLLQLNLSASFAREQALRHWLIQHEADIVNVEYADSVLLDCQIEVDQESELRQWCAAHSVTVVE